MVSLNCLCYNKLCHSFDFEVFNCNFYGFFRGAIEKIACIFILNNVK